MSRFHGQVRVGPRNRVLDGGLDRHGEGYFKRGNMCRTLAQWTRLVLAHTVVCNQYYAAGASLSSHASCCQITLDTC